MLYALGRIFFPHLLHQEKKLRRRMYIVAAIFGLVLIIGTVELVFKFSRRQYSGSEGVKRMETQKSRLH